MTGAPLGYLTAAGTRAAAVLPLTWYMLCVSVVVCVVIAFVLLQGSRRSTTSGGAAETRAAPLDRAPARTRWISVGLIISGVPLLIALVWTMVALAEVSGPPPHPGLTVDVFAHQWWWEVRYPSSMADESFSTANEIHVPVGVKVLLRLHGSDVIHSFWVPQLTGKTDMIPGQTNLSWIEANAPGNYRGQCGEYCGLQHAHMGFEVVAQSPQDFARWEVQQRLPTTQPQDDRQMHGRELVEYRCGACHEIRGTAAGARAAPDLTHLMSRSMLASGTMPNTPGNLVSWIEHAQLTKPGNLMPDQALAGSDLADVQSYLATLQ